jgi:phosphatidylserine/phosphatidylglycerophosphate/cardiolipin synthase-like enzyme
MDHARNWLIHKLEASDRQERFRAYAAMASDRVLIAVHSKIMIVDDRLLRVGSANLNNRSLGFDTECDLSIEAASDDLQRRQSIRRILVRLLSEHTGSTESQFAKELERTNSLLRVIELLTRPSEHHLEPLHVPRPSVLDKLMGVSHLFDPFGVADNWRPWTRLSARL